MATKKISELASAGALAGTEQLPVVQSGSTVKVALSALLAWITAALLAAKRLIPTGGTDGQYLRRVGIDGDHEWSSAGLVPDSSNAGYYLKQRSGTAGDYGFEPLPPPAGDPGAIQYSDSGVLAGSLTAKIVDGDLTLTAPGSVTPPAAGEVKVVGEQIANRGLPAFLGALGPECSLQPFWGRSRIGYWSAIGNASTAPVGVGIVAPTLISGTASSANVAATSLLESMRRIGNTSAATAASSCGFRQGTTQFFRSTNLWGGFHFVARFAESALADSRVFVGLHASTAAIGNVNPSTLLNTIGMAYDSGETTWRIIHNDSSGLANKIDLGANFPCNQSTQAYEISIYAPPGQSSVWVQVTRLGTSFSTTVQITTDLPALGTMLAVHMNANNGTTAATKTIVLVTMYIETDF